jgi:hypothetical protein
VVTGDPCTDLSIDEHTLDRLQRAAFGYFLEAANSSNGLIADTTRPGSPCSIAVVGFALSCYPIAVERGWMLREDAVERALTVLRFFRGSDQSGSPGATGHRGFYFHFLSMETGTRVWSSELSMVDTALLIAGALTTASYFTANTPEETELRELADFLYKRIDWNWVQDERGSIRQGWKPESGFLHYLWQGYNEAIVLYVLAMGSPTYPLDSNGYEAWTVTYQWENLYGHDFLYSGPLFIHQFSHAWIDLRGLRDRFMREKRSDYFENSRRAILVQQEYAKRNPNDLAGYDEHCWGLTACDGPTGEMLTAKQRRTYLFGYAARGVPYGPDDGTISGSAVLACLPFAPGIVLRTAGIMLQRYPEMLTGERYATSFNPSLVQDDGRVWVSGGHFGLDQGILVMMIENHRTELVWQLTRSCPYVRAGLLRAGFRDGWL